MTDPLRCRAWLPLLPLPEGTVGSVNGVPLLRDAFQRRYDESDVPKYADLCLPCPPIVERRARRSAMREIVDDELLRQRAHALGVEYDADRLALLERRSDRGLEDDLRSARHRASWRDRRIAELRYLAIRRAEGVRLPDDVGLAEALPGFFAEFLPLPAVALAEICVYDEAEAHRLHALATAPGADFGALAREHSCARSALDDGCIGVVSVRSAEGHAARAIAVGEVGPPVRSHRFARKAWRILRCIGRGSAEDLCSDAAVLACVRSSLARAWMFHGWAEVLRDLRRAASIVDDIDATMPSADSRVELPPVLARVEGIEITREMIVAELVRTLRRWPARGASIVWEAQLRYWLVAGLEHLVARARLVHEALARGVVSSADAASMLRVPSDALGEGDAARETYDAWSHGVRRTLEEKLREPMSEDTPWLDPKTATEALHDALASRYREELLFGENTLYDQIVDARDAAREIDEVAPDRDA